MAQQNQEKIFTIEPSWKQFFRGYVLSVLAIPVFGLGLIAFYFVRKKHRQIIYKISDSQITRIDSKYEHNVDLADIKEMEVQQGWLPKKLGIGTLILHTSASKMELGGLENPDKLKNILSQAIAAEAKRHRQRQETQKKEPDFRPGSMEKMNYLTGLWQQGLISDEEYEAERRHFE